MGVNQLNVCFRSPEGEVRSSWLNEENSVALKSEITDNLGERFSDITALVFSSFSKREWGSLCIVKKTGEPHYFQVPGEKIAAVQRSIPDETSMSKAVQDMINYVREISVKRGIDVKQIDVQQVVCYDNDDKSEGIENNTTVQSLLNTFNRKALEAFMAGKEGGRVIYVVNCLIYPKL